MSQENLNNNAVPKTDRQKLEEVFSEIGIDFELCSYKENTIQIGDGKDYCCIPMDFTFDENGKLLEYGAWK